LKKFYKKPSEGVSKFLNFTQYFGEMKVFVRLFKMKNQGRSPKNKSMQIKFKNFVQAYLVS